MVILGTHGLKWQSTPICELYAPHIKLELSAEFSEKHKQKTMHSARVQSLLLA